MLKYLITIIVFLTLSGCNSEPKENDMGLFDRFKKQVPTVTSELMKDDQFWSIIEQSLNSTNDLEEHATKLTELLSKLKSNDIIGFHLLEQKLRFDTYTPEMWCAGYIMNGGCSDDGFEYFRCWVIAHGKEVYYSSLKNPDWLASIYSKEIDYYDFEDLMYVASNAFEKKTGKDIEDFVDDENFKTDEGHHPDIQFNWQEEDEESMKAICPKLMEVAWE